MNHSKFAGGPLKTITIGIFVSLLLSACADNKQYDPYLNCIAKGDEQESFGNHGAAAKNYGDAIALDRKRALGYAKRGNAYLSDKNFSQALSDLDKAVELNPKDGDSWMSIGRYHLTLEHYPHAIEAFTHAIAIAPTGENYSLRADAYFQGRKEKEALADLQKSAELYLKEGQKEKCDQIIARIKKCRDEQ